MKRREKGRNVHKLCINCGQTLHHKTTNRKVEEWIKVYYSARMSVTYKPKKRKRAKTHGFLVRSKTASGANVIKRRRAKGRAKLSV